MAPEGAILSLVFDPFDVTGWKSFKTLSRLDGLLSGTKLSAGDLCFEVFVLLVRELVEMVGSGREVGVSGIPFFFAPLILPIM